MPAEAEPQANRFDHPIAVKDRDIDNNGHANNVVYLRWVQDAAVAHWTAVVEPEVVANLSWVVVRHEIDYKKPAFAGDALIATTWLGEITAATTERLCEIRREKDGELLARSRTIWCAIDAKSGRPKRLDARIRSYFFGGSKPG
ncbi:acyl-CoA thioesterase [Singulisphaera sp. PoT]|uniref:acyl-CoA thioesterase n=1 Tax=Singulisphaera sp. PoT TaxID=3411797 RepID=UPI003BF4C4CD